MTRLLVALVALVLAPALAAQTAGEVRRVVLTNGTVLVGTVADEGADPVVVLADGVEQRVPRALIREITPAPNGPFTRADPTRTRLFLSPTGRTIGWGRTRVGALLVVPNATVGLSDRIDLSGALVSTFGFASGGEDEVFIPIAGLKVGLVDTGTFAAAVGASAAVEFNGGVTEYVLVPYGAVTVGDEVRSVSASVAVLVGGTSETAGAEASDGFVLSAGGELQVTDRLKVLADVSVPFGDDLRGTSGSPGLPATVLAGVRLLGDHYAVDVFAAVIPGLPPLPLAAFSYTF